MYQEIANDLIKSIQNNLFQLKLPTEQQLMERYNVSRNTIRKAIDIVCQRGLARRIQGSGYYLTDIQKNNNLVLNLTMGISKRMNKITSKVITFDRIIADEAMAKEFGATAGDELHRIIRMRYLDGKPYSLEYAYYEREEVPFITIEAANNSLLEFINEEYGIQVNSSDQYIKMEPLTLETATILDQAEGEQKLVLRQSSFRKNDVLFNFSYTIFVYPDLSFYFHSFNQQ